MLLACLSCGLTFSDFCELKIGTLLGIVYEKLNQIEENKKENKNSDVREATSNDNIMSFF